MAVEFTPEFIQEAGLTEEQVTKVTGFVTPKFSELEETYKTKANDNTQGILGGIVNTLHEKTGFKLEREQGEKHADYLKRYSQEYTNHKLENESSEVTRLKSEYETKLKEFKGDEATQRELTEAKKKLDAALEKYANYDEISEKASKYEPLAEKNAALKKQVSFGSVKPSFPDTVDPRIIKVEWNEFIESVEKDWTVEFDTEKNEAVAIDKENPHNIVKLSSLVEKNEEIQKLLQGRQQQGVNAKEVASVEVEGVPFKVDLKGDIHKQIDKHLTSKGLVLSSNEYSDEYGKILEKIRKQQTAA